MSDRLRELLAAERRVSSALRDALRFERARNAWTTAVTSGKATEDEFRAWASSDSDEVELPKGATWDGDAIAWAKDEPNDDPPTPKEDDGAEDTLLHQLARD